jgi:hypothetical protein
LLHGYSRPALERSQHTSARSSEQSKRLELLRKPLSTALKRFLWTPPAAGSIPAAEPQGQLLEQRRGGKLLQQFEAGARLHHQRRHSPLGYVSPVDFELAAQPEKLAA